MYLVLSDKELFEIVENYLSTINNKAVHVIDIYSEKLPNDDDQYFAVQFDLIEKSFKPTGIFAPENNQ